MKVTVVGGGVIGLACAWELMRGGADVVVLESGSVGGGCSSGNAGWVCPSIAAPLPEPGMVREGFLQLVRRRGAFVLHPRLDVTFARWLWTFARSCRPARFEHGERAMKALLDPTLELYDAYRDAGVDFEMHETGLVLVGLTDEGLAPYRRLHRMKEVGAEIEPAVDGSAVVGVLHGTIDRYVRPETLTAGLARSLRAGGAEIREHARVDSLRDVGGEKVVVAAGLATPRLLPQVRMPLIGARGYSIDVAGTGTPPAHALYLAEARIGISPFNDTVRVAGIFEIGTRKPRPDAGAGLLAAAAPYLEGWRPTGEGETWSDLRPATADGLPLIGEVATDLYVAAGHTMLGITLAPATAALLAPLVLSGKRDPALACFDPLR
ncbi:MAG: NAD(P)/FAD-dependent oxidoreductase [Gaiellaceae bacterium]